MSYSILVLGLGELGLAVVRALGDHPKADPFDITVLLRPSTLSSPTPEKKQTLEHLQSRGVKFHGCDVVESSVAKLVSIFSEYDIVVSCNGMGLPGGSQIKLARAVLRAKVKRYIPWQFGVDYDAIGEGSSQDLFDEQLDVRRLLRSQTATDWLIVSTGIFLSFLFIPEFGIVDFEKDRVCALGDWHHQVTVTTPQDIGRATADLIADPRENHHRVVFTAGDTISYERLADLLDARYDKRFTRELCSREELQRNKRERGNVMDKYRDTFARGVGVAWPIEQTESYRREMKMTDVRQYIAEMAPAQGDES